MNTLFVCSKNEWRSRTAETLFRKRAGLHVKSAGTARTARIRVNAELIRWAETIFVMEDHHKRRMQEEFREALVGKTIVVLDIPDEYRYMDAELVAELEDVMEAYEFEN